MEACANACEVLKHLSHDANQPIRKFRSPDEWWKSSNNRVSTGMLFFRRASRSPNAQAPVVQARVFVAMRLGGRMLIAILTSREANLGNQNG